MVKLIAREKWLKTFCKINSCEASENKAINSVACEQAHRGALVAGRESLQPRLWSLNIYTEKVDAKC